MKCLIVDDSNATLFVTSKYMSTLGFDVSEAKSINQSLAEVDKTPFDVHIIDVYLGPESGVDLIKQLKAQNDSTPIIVLTGVDDDEKKQELKALGISDYLQKPTTLEKLHVSLIKIGLIK